MTESANLCDERLKYTGIGDHLFTSKKMIRNRRTGVKTVIIRCAWCGRLGAKTESKPRIQ